MPLVVPLGFVVNPPTPWSMLAEVAFVVVHVRVAPVAEPPEASMTAKGASSVPAAVELADVGGGLTPVTVVYASKKLVAYKVDPLPFTPEYMVLYLPLLIAIKQGPFVYCG